ncbi:MAG: SirB2 family protein [Gammaproteobacteria bacterium]|nr:SirB2 family protein [Gammaproteobacteria bacterium]
MNSYLLIKYIHITCALLSITGFVIRGVWLIRSSAWLQHRWVKRLPHLVDILLLVTALIMVYQSAQYPFVEHWLTTKVLLLVLYILLGMVALRWGKTRKIRIGAWFLAVLVFLFIISVATTRSSSGILQYF